MSKKGESGATHQALYRKYRPNALADVVGQSQVTEVLRRSLEQGKIAHAYLLTGPKGTGKTSIARIMAHEINQLPYTGEETHLDIIEIDAASNNGVEDVRELREKVQIAPVSAAKKVYIIDEVHMLSKAAFNALLKTLEEPPAHVVFVLATTDLHKVPSTIISRTQHFAFHSIGPSDLTAQLKKIASSEGMKITDDALQAIAERGDGSFRNSISLLDQLSSFADSEKGITLEFVQETLGLAPNDAVATLLLAVSQHDVPGVVSQLDTLERQGIQPNILADQLVHALRLTLAEQPQAVTLLDALLGVASSPQPQLKLLTTLVTAAKPKAPAAAHATKPRPTVLEAPVIVVEKTIPARNTPVEPATAESSETSAARVSSDAGARIETRSEAVSEDSGSGTANGTTDTQSAKPKRSTKAPAASDFDWAKVISHSKQNSVALYSVLSSCDAEYDAGTLTLFTGRKFNKTKLDEAKYLTQLHEALAASGYEGLTIVTLAEAKPPADEQLASIAAMMGGGQEVTLDEA